MSTILFKRVKLEVFLVSSRGYVKEVVEYMALKLSRDI